MKCKREVQNAACRDCARSAYSLCYLLIFAIFHSQHEQIGELTGDASTQARVAQVKILLIEHFWPPVRLNGKTVSTIRTFQTRTPTIYTFDFSLRALSNQLKKRHILSWRNKRVRVEKFLKYQKPFFSTNFFCFDMQVYRMI